MTPAPPDCRRSSPACAASGSNGVRPHFLAKGARPGITRSFSSPTCSAAYAASATWWCAMRVSARPWARALARHLMRREHRALSRLALADGIEGIPRALKLETAQLTRSWIEGTPMHVARPRDLAYFRAASRLLRRLHAANVIHNDLAKETNWLVTPEGLPALVDFQLAMTLAKRGALARALGHDDLRHLLKHKRTYVPHRTHRARAAHPRHAFAALAPVDGQRQEGLSIRDAQDIPMAGPRGRGRPLIRHRARPAPCSDGSASSRCASTGGVPQTARPVQAWRASPPAGTRRSVPLHPPRSPTPAP